MPADLGRVSTLAHSCAVNAIREGLHLPDAEALRLLPREPMHGDWEALAALLGREPDAEEVRCFEAVFREEMTAERTLREAHGREQAVRRLRALGDLVELVQGELEAERFEEAQALAQGHPDLAQAATRALEALARLRDVAQAGEGNPKTHGCNQDGPSGTPSPEDVLGQAGS